MDTFPTLRNVLDDFETCFREYEGSEASPEKSRDRDLGNGPNVMIRFKNVVSFLNFSRFIKRGNNYENTGVYTEDRLKQILPDDTVVYSTQKKTLNTNNPVPTTRDNRQRWDKFSVKKIVEHLYWKVYKYEIIEKGAVDTAKNMKHLLTTRHIISYSRSIDGQKVIFSLSVRASSRQQGGNAFAEFVSLEKHVKPKWRMTLIINDPKKTAGILMKLFYNVSSLDDVMFETGPMFVPDIKTRHRAQLDILTRNDPRTLYVTPKVDGQTCTCRVQGGRIYAEMFINTIICYDTNISEEHIVEFVGEYIKVGDTRVIYPFFVHSIDGEKIPNRWQQLNALGKIVDNRTTRSDPRFMEIRFKDIRYGFESIDDLAKAIADVSEVSMPDVPTDGAVVFLADSNVDWKFKFSKTVDLVATVGVGKQYIVNDKGERRLELRCSKWNPEQSRFVSESSVYANTLKINLDPFLHFLVENRPNTVNVYVPPVAVIEMQGAIEDSSLSVRHIRWDKTDMMYNKSVLHKGPDLGRFFYNGNPKNVVDSILLENNMYSLEKLRTNKFSPADRNTVSPYANVVERLWVLNEGSAYYRGNDEENRKSNDQRVLCNFVSSNLIYQYNVPLVTRKRLFNVLDIDGGRGGAFSRFIVPSAENVDLTDPNFDNIQMAKKRYEKLLLMSKEGGGTEQTSKRKRIFRLETAQTSVLDPRFPKIVKTMRGITSPPEYGLINMQFSIHYSLFDGYIVDDTGIRRPSSSYDTVIANINELCSKGTRVIITTMDGEAVLKMFARDRLETLVFDVGNKQKFKIQKYTDTVRVHKLGVVMCSTDSFESNIEYLVSPEKLKRSFIDKGFECLSSGSFANMIPNFYDFYKTGEAVSKTSSALSFMKKCGESFARAQTTKSPNVMDLMKLYYFLVLQKK